MEQISKSSIKELKENINAVVADLNIDQKKSRLGELQTESLDQNIWNDQERAKKVLKEIEYLKDEIQTAQTLESDVDALEQMLEGADENEITSLSNEYEDLFNRFKQFEKLKFLSGKYDGNNAILSIHSGQGGTEANDWAEMLMRMYLRYCERMGWAAQIQHMVSGSEAGISTATMIIDGKYAFGLLKRESGTHRLVRVSPFNSQGLRQTSFAGVEVIPVVEDNEVDIQIPESDIIFKAVKASGAGGQHVNKTASAVQITHIPTGITVHNSEQRSQAQNRIAAMKILKAKLWQIEEDKREKEIKDIKGEHKVAGWGNQIRNYVLHPYKLVKDLRTQVESSDPDSVLDGELDQFIEALIRIS